MTGRYRITGRAHRPVGYLHRDQQKTKKTCVKTFVEKYDMVTTPSGEVRSVNQEMTVQVEQWWNSSDITVSLRQENTWVTDDTVVVVGKQKMHS